MIPAFTERRDRQRKELESLFRDALINRSKPFWDDFQKLMAYYRCAMMEIETKFNVLNEEYSLQLDRNPIADIKTRLKSPMSIKDKLERKGLPLTLEAMQENLQDIAGVRVICSFPRMYIPWRTPC